MKRLWVLIFSAFLLMGCSSSRIEKSRLDVLRGSIDQNRYINSYFNIVGDFGDDWFVFDRDELQEESFFQTSGSAYVVFFAEKDYGLQCANVTIEDINYNETEQTLLDLAKDSLKSDLQKQGVSNIEQQITEINYAGKKTNCIITTGLLTTNEEESVPIFTRQILLEKNRYLATITLSSLKEDYTEDIAMNFYHLD